MTKSQCEKYIFDGFVGSEAVAPKGVFDGYALAGVHQRMAVSYSTQRLDFVSDGDSSFDAIQAGEN